MSFFSEMVLMIGMGEERGFAVIEDIGFEEEIG
jgi:hypothetical protein